MSGTDPILLYPAIDLIDGEAVRLDRGEFDAQTTYDRDPLDAARRWVDSGARALHIVDLDGARTGSSANLRHVQRIVSALGVPIQVGGGLRDAQAVDAALNAGAARVIIGTAAFKDPDFLTSMVAAHGDRVIVSVDTRAGMFAAAGWTEQTDISTADALAGLLDQGVTRFVYSSIERDGMLTGPDLEGARGAAATIGGSAQFTYSGGIAALEDLQGLADLRLPSLTGIIAGKAIYERRFEVGAAQDLLDKAARG
jgi:phosphoribosylformimino-5-aminoimidazole carboxamide ribotide isomerase